VSKEHSPKVLRVAVLSSSSLSFGKSYINKNYALVITLKTR